jgi:hypothetical protein
LDRDNKSTVNRRSGDGRVVIFAAVWTCLADRTILSFSAFLQGMIVSAGARGICDMQRLGSLLRSTRSRIGRRLALIVAIAAASLPAAGA